jgi:MFS superfamily sulfate permease-like transporter
MTIAVVASIESLLSVEASDKLDPFRRISSTNRELFAQGAGNIVSGLLGGLPVTAVIVRSSANIYAGARTKTSGFLHGILILIAVLLIPGLLNKIPLACLAAILIAVGYKLAHPSLFYQMYKDGASQYVPFVLTILGIVFTDLLTGVLLGMVLGLYFVVKTNHHDALTIVHEESNYLVRLNKDLSFINKAELKDALETIPDNTTVMLDGTKSMFIDHDIYDIVKDFKAQSHHRGITVSEKNMTSKNLPLKFRKD